MYSVIVIDEDTRKIDTFSSEVPPVILTRQSGPFGFEDAIRYLKAGKAVTREGWNGKNQFVAIGRNIKFSMPFDGNRMNTHFHKDFGSDALVFFGTRGSQVGWLASQADMLAEDWKIYGEE